mgnify:CR=1 FL=1
MSAWNDFNDAEQQQSFDLIPKGTVARVRMTIKPGGFDDPAQGWNGGYATQSFETGSVYLSCEFVILEGECEVTIGGRRKAKLGSGDFFGEVALLDDRGGKARLGKDHHPRGRLQKMGTGARAHHQKEGILNFSMQPDDPGESAENRSLSAFGLDIQGLAITGGRRYVQRNHRAHACSPLGKALGVCRLDDCCSICNLAALNLSRN